MLAPSLPTPKFEPPRESWSSEQVELGRASPGGLALATSRNYELPPHLSLVDRKCTEVVHKIVTRDDPEGLGHGPRLMIFMPPRHGKSMTATQFNVAWTLGMFPDLYAVIASYADSLALGWARRARDLLKEVAPDFYGSRVKAGVKAAGAWEMEGGGSCRSVGIGSGLTGHGAHLMVIDDPLKDAEQAQSEVIREKCWDWWETTARTRLMPGGGVILIMTRWHEDDLAGRLLKAEHDGYGDKWEVISMPALAEEKCTATFEGGVRELGPDPLGRMPGEALWPEQYDEASLAKTRAQSPSLYWFSAMYQQRPAPEEGGLLKREHFRYWRGYVNGAPHQVSSGLLMRDEGARPIDLNYCMRFMTVDTAATEKETSDYTVVASWAVTPDSDLLLLHRERLKLDTPEQPGLIAQQYNLFRPEFVAIEDKNTGMATKQEITRLGLPVRVLKADQDKLTRAIPAGMRLEQHTVYFPEEADWLYEWTGELANFPNAAHDDQVDVFAYAARLLPDLAVTRRRKPDAARPVTAALSQRDA